MRYSCFLWKSTLFFSELCHYFPSTLNGYSGSAHLHRMKEASARGSRVHGPFFPCVLFPFSFTAVHKLLDASDIDGIICIVLWRWLELLCPQNILCTGVRGGLTFEWESFCVSLLGSSEGVKLWFLAHWCSCWFGSIIVYSQKQLGALGLLTARRSSRRPFVSREESYLIIN
jgi:hypothetical protein